MQKVSKDKEVFTSVVLPQCKIEVTILEASALHLFNAIERAGNNQACLQFYIVSELVEHKREMVTIEFLKNLSIKDFIFLTERISEMVEGVDLSSLKK